MQMNDTRRNWAGILGVCLVFALGMVSGAAVTIRVFRARTEQMLFSPQAGATMMDRVGDRLSARLNCDPHQREELRNILFDARRDLRQTKMQIAPQLREVFGQTASRIRGILREDQLKTFDAMIARTREHRSLAGLMPFPTGVARACTRREALKRRPKPPGRAYGVGCRMIN